MSRTGRRKGKRGEQDVVRMLRGLFPEVRTKRAGGESASVDRGRDLLGTPGYCIQVKAMRAPAPLAALEEALAAASPKEVAVAFVKQSCAGNQHTRGQVGGRWVAVLRAEDLLSLMQPVHPDKEVEAC
ncbi:MAG TPA: hypothetical protein VN903_36485 [Polyangia bacterium]|nr:hypothetical protein [Polyangia bacterium]